MGVLGDVSKGILLFVVFVEVVLIIQFIILNQTALAVLFFVALIIPFVFVAVEYHRSSREFQCNNCKHRFTVSHLKLLFTKKFRGTDPAPTGATAYDLKCPKCNEKDCLIPSVEKPIG
jgi:hypothetical protein